MSPGAALPSGTRADLGGPTRTPLLDLRAATRDGDTLRTPWLSAVDEALERHG